MAHTQRELDWSSGFHAGKASGERGYRFRDDRAFRACVEALRRYGFDHGGVWHEFGCPGWNTPSLSMCGPRCVQGRDALALAQAADTEQEEQADD